MTKTYKDKILDSLKDKEPKKEKPIYTASFDDLVDLVENDGEVKFLTFDGELYGSRIIDEKTYLPPEKVDWALPKADIVLEEYKKHTDVSDDSDGVQGCRYCQKELYPIILDYFKLFSEPPTEHHYHFLVWMAFHSYLIEKFNFSPILFLVATKDRGKTPTLKALSYIARRGIFTETFREANLIRWSSNYKASLFFDVRNFPRKVEQSNSEDLIFGRAERGVTSSRVLHPEKGAFKDMVTFSTFGVTGATSNRMVDAITEARCIVFNMPYSPRVFEVEPTEEMGLPLKEKLTAFRMAHFNTQFLEIKKELPGKLENYLRGYHKMIKTIFPLYEKEFSIFKKIVTEQKLEEAESSFEAKIIKIVLSLRELVEEGGLCLTYDDICNEYNRGKSERLIDERAMSSILKGLGFSTKRNKEGNKRGIFYDEDFIDKLKINYGLENIEVHPLTTSETSEVSENEEIKPDEIPF